MKDTHFRVAATVGGGVALVVLLVQFGTFSFDRNETHEHASAAAATQSSDLQDFDWRGALESGQTLEIKGINGSVEARPSTSGQVEVIAEKRGRRSDPSTVEIRAVRHAGGVTVCAVYPSSGSRENTCEPGSGGRNNVRNNDVQVKFMVAVPAEVGLVARTVNGSVKAENVEGDVHANTVNGSITISTAGWAEASTVNGSINATIGADRWEKDLNFNTVNGSITVHVPEDAHGDVTASTVGGRLSSEFPLDVSRRRMSGVIGRGGPTLKLSTVNGTVRLMKRP